MTAERRLALLANGLDGESPEDCLSALIDGGVQALTSLFQALEHATSAQVQHDGCVVLAALCAGGEKSRDLLLAAGGSNALRCVMDGDAPLAEPTRTEAPVRANLDELLQRREGGQWQLCGVVEKTIEGELKSHRFVRADRFPGKDEAVDFTLVKGQQLVDQAGESVFR